MARAEDKRAVAATLEPAPVTPDTIIAELRRLDASDRLLALYDLGLDGYAARNAAQVTAVLDELISMLDFTGHPEIAEGFQRIYLYCREQAVRGTFEGVGFILHDLRDTFARAAAAERDAQSRPA